MLFPILNCLLVPLSPRQVAHHLGQPEIWILHHAQFLVTFLHFASKSVRLVSQRRATMASPKPAPFQAGSRWSSAARTYRVSSHPALVSLCSRRTAAERSAQ